MPGIERNIKRRDRRGKSGKPCGRKGRRSCGREEGRLEAIKNVMASFGVSVEKAMDSLKIPQKKRSMYMSML